jgi:uncharacterized repeat protein (TIGR01451 family)
MAKAHNLKIIPDFLDDVRAGYIADRHGSEENALDYLEQVMSDHSNDPNLLFWWLKNEWDHGDDAYGSPHLFSHQLSQRQRQSDPNRPGFLVGMGECGVTEWNIMGEKCIATTLAQKMHSIYKQKANGDKYLITLNSSSTTQSNVIWKLSDLGIGTKTLIVLFETRTVTATNGSFQDTYKPYERHVYKIPETAKPKITLHKTADKKYTLQVGTLTYTITYTNEGQGPATDVVIIEVLPEKCKMQNVKCKMQNVEIRYWYAGGWQTEFSELATKIRWLIPEVAPASSDTVSFTVEVR